MCVTICHHQAHCVGPSHHVCVHAPCACVRAGVAITPHCPILHSLLLIDRYLCPVCPCVVCCFSEIEKRLRYAEDLQQGVERAAEERSLFEQKQKARREADRRAKQEKALQQKQKSVICLCV